MVSREYPIPAEELCVQCRSMFSSIDNLRQLCWGWDFDHYQTSRCDSEARENDRLGCQFCQDTLSLFGSGSVSTYPRFRLKKEPGLKQIDSGDYPDYPVGVLRSKVFETECHRKIDTSTISSGAESYRAIDIFTSSSDGAASRFMSVPPLVYNMAGDAVAKQILHRLDECQDSHKICPGQVNPLLPTRVIDVELQGGNPRLHLSTSGQRATYTALSYCWGDAQQFTTTIATLHSMTLGILLDSFPETIQDAIVITRNLQIQYLWVDALCIVQDDPADKATEIKGMGAIYKHALLTIAAMDAEAAHHGFIKDSKSPRGCLFPILLPDGSFDEIELLVRRPKSDPSQAKLDTRGWALQEFLLSPRLLLFYEKEVLWHCQTQKFSSLIGRWSEDKGPQWPRSVAVPSNLRMPHSIFLEATGETEKRHSFSNAQVWTAIVRDFSSRVVRLEVDKFHAMVGIVSELRKVWRDPYTAGFWHSTLLWNLSWHHDRSQRSLDQRLSRPSYSAPSWSWLSVSGRISLPYYDTPPQAELVACWVQPMDIALPDGPFCDGVISIKTWALSARDIVGGVDVEFIDKTGGLNDLDYQDPKQCTTGLKLSYDWEREIQVQSRTFMLLGVIGPPALPICIGLILEEVLDKRFKPCFRRIGRWEHNAKNTALMQKWMKGRQDTFHIV